jgi:glycosyltransferase involved in cell wall biosynthesis
LDSILKQTYGCFELIIIDDNSQDGTINLLNKYKKRDQRVEVFSQVDNKGCAKSFEAAINKCSGDYIVLCDHDDIWESNKLEELINNIGSAVLIYSDCAVIDEVGNEKYSSFSFVNSMHGMSSSRPDFRQFSYFNSFILGCSIMFDARLKADILPIVDEGYNHDKWIVNVAATVGKIKYINKKLFRYRVHENNLSFKKDEIPFFKRKKVKKPYYSKLATNRLKECAVGGDHFSFGLDGVNDTTSPSFLTKLLFINLNFRFLFVALPFKGRLKACVSLLIND